MTPIQRLPEYGIAYFKEHNLKKVTLKMIALLAWKTRERSLSIP
jgi:hypothetical protein